MKTVTLDELIAGLQAIRATYLHSIRAAYGEYHEPLALTVEGAISINSSEVFPPAVDGLPDSFHASVQSWWWENMPF